MKLELFLDMDGVLCDFVTAAHAACGCTFNPVTYPKGVWPVWEAMGMSESQMWNHIDSFPYFWKQLEIYPWCGELLDLADDVKILTSPHYTAECYQGKLVKYIPRSVELILCKSKHLLAKPGRVLIDDSDENCHEWRGAGGIAILFPTVLNANWRLALDPITYVKDEWIKIQREHSPVTVGKPTL